MKNKPKNTTNEMDLDMNDAHEYDEMNDVELDENDSEDDIDDESSEMLFILETIYEFITTMLSKGVHPHLIQSSLLANWLQIVVMNCDETEEFFLTQIEKIETFIPVIVSKISEISKMLPDEITDFLSDEARSHFTEMQTTIRDMSKQEMSPEDFTNQESIVEAATEKLFEVFEQSNAHPLDVEAAFLFYWIHFLGMDHEFSDAKIEKLIYYWGDVFEPMAIFVRSQMGLEDAF
ncbi:MAG: hypothetical protein V4482_05935 [Pseudomonadota bacterium]